MLCSTENSLLSPTTGRVPSSSGVTGEGYQLSWMRPQHGALPRGSSLPASLGTLPVPQLCPAHLACPHSSPLPWQLPVRAPRLISLATSRNARAGGRAVGLLPSSVSVSGTLFHGQSVNSLSTQCSSALGLPMSQPPFARHRGEAVGSFTRHTWLPSERLF